MGGEFYFQDTVNKKTKNSNFGCRCGGGFGFLPAF